MQLFIDIKKIWFFTIAILFLLVGAYSCRSKQNVPDTKLIAEENNEVKYDNSDKGKDAMFLVNAAETDLAEIELGQLAEQNGRSTHVKALGRMMAVAHSKSLYDLIQLAKNKSIAIPTSQTALAKEAFKKLGSKSGVNFDKAYCDLMVDRHSETVTTFDKAVGEINDTDIRKWVVHALPSLYVQLDSARMCQKKLMQL